MNTCDCGCFGHGINTESAPSHSHEISHTHTLTGVASGAAGVTPTIPVSGQVPVTLEQLSESISSLEEEINALAGRLAPVLIDAEALPSKTGPEPVLLSPVARNLFYTERRITDLIKQVIEIKNLLTV